MKLVGIDPGDRWIGLAGIRTRKNGDVELHSAVLDTTKRNIRDKVDDALSCQPDQVFCEDFRARPQGHQAFNAMMTPRLIGALELVCLTSDIPFGLIQPGSVTDVEQIVPVIAHEFIKRMKAEQWNHSMSAWRVLLRGLLQTEWIGHLRSFRETNLVASIEERSMWTGLTKKDFKLSTLVWSNEE